MFYYLGCLEQNFDMTSQIKQQEIMQYFMHDELLLCSWHSTMSEEGASLVLEN